MFDKYFLSSLLPSLLILLYWEFFLFGGAPLLLRFILVFFLLISLNFSRLNFLLKTTDILFFLFFLFSILFWTSFFLLTFFLSLFLDFISLSDLLELLLPFSKYLFFIIIWMNEWILVEPNVKWIIINILNIANNTDIPILPIFLINILILNTNL